MTSITAPKARYLPPTVQAEFGKVRGVGVIALVGGLWSLGLLAVLAGVPWQAGSWPWGLAVLLASTVAAGFELRPRGRFLLAWSAAQGWLLSNSCETDGRTPSPCTPQVVLDLQKIMLLRVRAASGVVHWLWCEQQEARQWHRLRCALFARRQP